MNGLVYLLKAGYLGQIPAAITVSSLGAFFGILTFIYLAYKALKGEEPFVRMLSGINALLPAAFLAIFSFIPSETWEAFGPVVGPVIGTALTFLTFGVIGYTAAAVLNIVVTAYRAEKALPGI